MDRLMRQEEKISLIDLKYIHQCLVKLSHYKIRGTINYPPAHLGALFEHYQVKPFILDDVLRLFDARTKNRLIHSLVDILRLNTLLEADRHVPQIYYAHPYFKDHYIGLVNAIYMLEDEMRRLGIRFQSLDDSDVVPFP